MPVLLAVDGPSAGVRFEIDNDADVGRSSICRIRVLDGKMSRRHAVFTRDGATVQVADLGSRNGTYVNGNRITGSARLSAGDRVRIGETTFVFEPAVDLIPARFTGGALVLDDLSTRMIESPRELEAGEGPLLGRLARRIAGETDEAGLLAAACELVAGGLGAQAGCVLTVAGGRLGVPGAIVGRSRILLTSAWIASVIEGQRPAFGRIEGPEGSRLVLSAPIRLGEVALGMIHLEREVDAGGWGEEALGTLEGAGLLLGLALGSLQRLARAAGGAGGKAALDLVGESPAFRVLRRAAEALVESDAVLVLEGERGSGRHHLARWLHHRSPRAAGPFEVLRVGGMDAASAVVALFGRESAGAEGDRYETGALERADGGTLYLEDVDALPLVLQSRIARGIEQRAVIREGGRQAVPIDVRLVASRAPGAEGVRRREVARALGRRRLECPPLREREGDLPRLFDYFAARAAGAARAPLELSPDGLRAAERYGWPGNLEELDLVIRRLAIAKPSGGAVKAGELPASGNQLITGANVQLSDQVSALEAQEIERVLREEGGRKLHAARRLGISRPTLDRKLGLYGIKISR